MAMEESVRSKLFHFKCLKYVGRLLFYFIFGRVGLLKIAKLTHTQKNDFIVKSSTGSVTGESLASHLFFFAVATQNLPEIEIGVGPNSTEIFSTVGSSSTAPRENNTGLLKKLHRFFPSVGFQ